MRCWYKASRPKGITRGPHAWYHEPARCAVPIRSLILLIVEASSFESGDQLEPIDGIGGADVSHT
jgi:hypothetical protein